MNFTIKKAEESQIPELKKIWIECFGDSEAYVDMFFEKRFKSTVCLTAVYQNKTIGAMYLLPVFAYEYGKIKNGWYGYAVGVLKEYRKNGIYAAMHNKICKYLKANNEFYILCPANRKLYDFYRTLGFSDYAFLKDTTILPNGETSADLELNDITPAEYVILRNSYFNNNGLIFWNETAIEYAMEENKFCNGFAASLNICGKEYALFARINDETIKIIESTVPQKHILTATNFLCKKYGVKSAVWTRAAYETEGGDEYISCIGVNIKKADFPYINLLLN